MKLENVCIERRLAYCGMYAAGHCSFWLPGSEKLGRHTTLVDGIQYLFALQGSFGGGLAFVAIEYGLLLC